MNGVVVEQLESKTDAAAATATTAAKAAVSRPLSLSETIIFASRMKGTARGHGTQSAGAGNSNARAYPPVPGRERTFVAGTAFFHEFRSKPLDRFFSIG